MIAIIMGSFYSVNAQVHVNTLEQLHNAVQGSDQEIIMQAGNYNLEDLNVRIRVITCSGSNNTINLTGVYISVPVGCIKETYFIVSGNNNTVIGGEIEDVYRSGLTEVTDFSAYNQDRNNFAYGLSGAAVMTVSGADNLIDGIKLTVRGSFPYGYGSTYGINQYNTFGLDKRCGLLINGARNTVDNVEIQQRALGHALYMQGDADNTLIKNTLVEGRVRATAELYDENQPYDLPSRSGFVMPYEDDRPIPRDEVLSLCEDGFRQYTGVGSVTLENSTAKKMRGGVRFYLGGAATVTNTTSIDCGNTNWNMPHNGIVTKSSGNFAYAPLSDFRLSRNNMNIEWTIIPSPNATGPHNLVDVLGSKHNIVFHRTPGPIDTDLRPIVITGDDSTIINETEYPIILESGAVRNTIVSCGSVTDNGRDNIISECDNPILSVENSNVAFSNKPIMYPSIVSSLTIIENAENSVLSIYDVNGSRVFTVNILSNSEVVNLSSLAKGVYLANVITDSTKRILKLIKE
tara:strand:- start:2058 stop:3608 length:1551 start_codon:yes stop_codon:yes gene_type:complete